MLDLRHLHADEAERKEHIAAFKFYFLITSFSFTKLCFDLLSLHTLLYIQEHSQETLSTHLAIQAFDNKQPCSEKLPIRSTNLFSSYQD